MPNWCSNSLTLRHDDTTKLDALEAQLKKVSDPEAKEDDVLNFLIPNPAGEWDYGWSCENWGTKWDIQPHDFTREDENTLHMSFDSAWSPPIEAYNTLLEDEWEVTAYYEEPGMGFCGKYDNGDDESYEYDFSDPDWRDDIPEDVVDYAGLEYAYEDWKEWNEEESEDTDESKVD